MRRSEPWHGPLVYGYLITGIVGAPVVLADTVPSWLAWLPAGPLHLLTGAYVVTLFILIFNETYGMRRYACPKCGHTLVKTAAVSPSHWKTFGIIVGILAVIFFALLGLLWWVSR